jgi:hypothetical protein
VTASLPLVLAPAPAPRPRCGLVLHDLGEPFVCGLDPDHLRRGEEFHVAQGGGRIRCWRDDSQVVLRGGDVPAREEPASVQLRLDDIRAGGL